MDFGRQLIRGLLQLGSGGPNLRSQSGRVEARTAANDGFAPILADQVRLGSETGTWFRKNPSADAAEIFLGASNGSGFPDGVLIAAELVGLSNVSAAQLRLYRNILFAYLTLSISQSPPVSPQTGDQWLEVNSSGLAVYGWWWTWSGTYWLSPEMRRSLSFDNASATSRIYFDCDQTLDYFFKSILLNGVVVTTNNGTSNWSAQVERISNAAAITSIGSAASSSAQAADAGFAVSTAINTHVDVSAVNARQFRVVLTRNSTPGNFFGSATAVFNYART